MATLTIPNSFNNGEVIDAPEMNANFTAVKNFAESLSAGNNFDVGAISTTDIADSSIVASKIATGAVTSSKIASSVALTTPDIGAATGTSLSVTGQVTDHTSITQITGSTHTLALVNDGYLLEMTNSTAVTITVPADSSVVFPVGTKITLLQVGAGQVTVQGAGGVTVNATPGLKLRAQWSAGTLIKRAVDTWVLMGDLSA